MLTKSARGIVFAVDVFALAGLAFWGGADFLAAAGLTFLGGADFFTAAALAFLGGVDFLAAADFFGTAFDAFFFGADLPFFG